MRVTQYRNIVTVGRKLETVKINSISIPTPPDFAAVENINTILVASFLVQLSVSIDNTQNSNYLASKFIGTTHKGKFDHCS